jgi:adenylate cyclase
LKPKAIALDLLLIDPGPVDGDAALAQALKQAKSIIAAAAVFPDSRQSVVGDEGLLAGLPNAQELLLPQLRFTDAASFGLVNVQTDKSGVPRFAPMLFLSGDRIEPSFPLSVVTAATGTEPGLEPDGVTIGGHVISTDIGHLLPIAFYGPRGTIPTVSASAALIGKLPEALIKDHVVVVGATVTGGGDVFPTPFDPVLPGVEVISTAISHLLAGDGLVRNHSVRQLDLGFAVALPLILVGLLAWRRSAIGLVAMLAVAVIWLSTNFIAFTHGIWLAAALPIAAAVPPVILFGASGAGICRYSGARPSVSSRPGAAGCGGGFHRHQWLYRSQRDNRSKRGARASERLLRSCGKGGDRLWRRHHELHGRWGDDPFRPAFTRAGRCGQCCQMLCSADTPHARLDRYLA